MLKSLEMIATVQCNCHFALNELWVNFRGVELYFLNSPGDLVDVRCPYPSVPELL